MIIQTTKEINGVMYDYAYSDSGFMIERDGVRYSEAVDPIGSNRVYTETDESIEAEARTETGEKALAYDILTGVSEEHITAEGAAAEQDISGDEFLSMIEEVL